MASGSTPVLQEILRALNSYDRTMVRIGWMNMILHGVNNPQIHQRDSLGKIKHDDLLKDLLKSESFEYVLANPPFTGTVDKGSLDLDIFPKARESGKKASLPLTDKSELLFICRILDLLQKGGRCAVIIPEGVLFGSTEAHKRLRRELLTEHTVEAVISLPSGSFQPYTPVKTSILVFKKGAAKGKEAWNSDQLPSTKRVWFYEVTEEAYSTDARRHERKGDDYNNDLWDMLAKFKKRESDDTTVLGYYQPEHYVQRWRLVGDNTYKVFAENKEISKNKDKIVASHELFGDLPEDPALAEKQIQQAQEKRLKTLLKSSMLYNLRTAGISPESLHKEKNKRDQRLKDSQSTFRSVLLALLQAKKQQQIFEEVDSLAKALFRQTCKSVEKQLLADFADETKIKLVAKQKPSADDVLLDSLSKKIAIEHDSEQPNDVLYTIEAFKRENFLNKKLTEIAREYAKLDGYNVTLRSIETVKREAYLKESKSWWADVRVYARNDSWQSDDGALQGSHDKIGKVRPDYLKSIELYNENNKLNEEYLDPDCIEARGWNLSAGQYKPFNFAMIENEQSVAEVIAELEGQEQKILEGLGKLKSMVGNSA